MKTLKINFKTIFIIFCLFFLSFVSIKADGSLEEFLNYANTQKTISTIKTTIIPNSTIIESKDNSIRVVSSDFAENIGDVKDFVIGEKRIISTDDYNWLCKIVQCEAGGEDEIGKILVANVIFNRFDTGRYGDTLYGVIFAPSQFSPVGSGSIYSANPSEGTIAAVEKAMNGVDYSQGALFFMNRSASDAGNVTWFDTALTFVLKHGGHEFFK